MAVSYQNQKAQNAPVPNPGQQATYNRSIGRRYNYGMSKNAPYGGVPAPSSPGPAPVGTSGVPPSPQVAPDLIVVNSRTTSKGLPHPDMVMGLLFMLIVVNGFSSGQFQKIWSTLIGKQGAVKHDFLVLGGEFAFAVGLSMIAGMGSGATKVILALTIALWILWGMQNVKHIQSFTKKASIKG